jgi:hypothetical protein
LFEFLNFLASAVWRSFIDSLDYHTGFLLSIEPHVELSDSIWISIKECFQQIFHVDFVISFEIDIQDFEVVKFHLRVLE